MNLDSIIYTLKLTKQDIDIWLSALEYAAKDQKNKFINSPQSNPFYIQHEELTRKTGLNQDEHQNLITYLSPPKKLFD